MNSLRRALRFWLVSALVLSMSAAAFSATTMTNADLIKLLDAGMPEAVVLQSINASQGTFDTSAKALIQLRDKGASPAVLKAVIARSAGPATRSTQAASPQRSAPETAAASGVLGPDDASLVSDGQEQALQFLIPNMRTAARGLGFGGVATYVALDGDKAKLRLNSGTLEFLVSVPKNAQPASYVTVASFVVRPTGVRELSVAGGYASYSARIPRDRLVPSSVQVESDQSRAPDGFVLHRVTTTQSLKPGEYGLLVTQAGAYGGMPTAGYKVFDFGID